MREYCVRAEAEIQLHKQQRAQFENQLRTLRCERDQGLDRIEELEQVLEAKDDEMLEDLEMQVSELSLKLSKKDTECQECLIAKTIAAAEREHTKELTLGLKEQHGMEQDSKHPESDVKARQFAEHEAHLKPAGSVPPSPDRVVRQAKAHLKKWRECAPASPWTAGHGSTNEKENIPTHMVANSPKKGGGLNRLTGQSSQLAQHTWHRQSGLEHVSSPGPGEATVTPEIQSSARIRAHQ
jgi:hypothetical protein